MVGCSRSETHASALPELNNFMPQGAKKQKLRCIGGNVEYMSKRESAMRMSGFLRWEKRSGGRVRVLNVNTVAMRDVA